MAKILIDFPDNISKFLQDNKKIHKVSAQSFVVSAVEDKMNEIMDIRNLREKVALRFFASEELKSNNIKNP